MEISKQLFLCIVLFGIYIRSSMCMNNQGCTFDMLPQELQEHIIELLPANNLYRALWSRYNNASQKFYDDYVKTYLESHFVPQELIDKTLAKDFAYFHGWLDQKQDFKNKIKSALTKYSQSDTDILTTCKQNFALRSENAVYAIPQLFFDQTQVQLVQQLMYGTESERADLVLQLSENGELCHIKKRLQKYLACITYSHDWFPFITDKKQVLAAVTFATYCLHNYWLQSKNYKMVELTLRNAGLLCCLISGILYAIKHFTTTTDSNFIRNIVRAFKYDFGMGGAGLSDENIFVFGLDILYRDGALSLDEAQRYCELVQKLPISCINIGIIGTSIKYILETFTNGNYRVLHEVCQDVSVAPLYTTAVCLGLFGFAKLIKHSVFYAHKKLMNSSYNYLVVYISQFEELQTKISQVLNVIHELESA